MKKQVALTGEGWGLCYDGTRLVQSDGSATLRFRNPTTFAQTGALTVTLDGKPVPQLNELECVGRARCGRTSGRPRRSCASTRRAAG